MHKCIYGKYTIISQVFIQESITRIILKYIFSFKQSLGIAFYNPNTIFPFARGLRLDVRLVFLCYNMLFL